MKILVVEDDMEILRVLNKRLSADGFHVLTASRGEEAIVLAQTERPDLIVMDIMLPDIDGAEVVKRLRANPLVYPAVPVLFLSGIVSVDELTKKTEVVVRGQTFPAIAKPFSYETLLAKIKTISRTS